MKGPCSGCQVVYINGLRCHEAGCTESWRGLHKACFECGCDFVPDDRFQRTCESCLEDIATMNDCPEPGESLEDYLASKSVSNG